MKDRSKLLIYLSLLTAFFLCTEVWCKVGDECTDVDLTNCTTAADPTAYMCNNSICECNDGYYENATNCLQKLNYEGECTENKQCLRNMTCLNGDKCGCGDLFYHENNTCLSKLSFEAECQENKQCLRNMTCLSGKCGCDDTHYHENNTCISKAGYNETCVSPPEDTCNVANGGCFNGFCKCNENFYTDTSQCKPVLEITVTNLSVTTTTTTITFTWTVSSSDFIKHFIITGTGAGLTSTTVNKDLTTAAITGLRPGTTYTNLQIKAVVTTDRGDVNRDSNIITATTKSGYNEVCQTSPVTCIEENTSCYPAPSTTASSCKCNTGYYRDTTGTSTTTGTCKQVSGLAPTDVTISVVARQSFTVSWTPVVTTPPELVTGYIVTGSAGINTDVDKTLSSTLIDNLQPGTSYTNIQVTVTIKTDRGPVTAISTQSLSTVTRSNYNETCFTSDDKCDVSGGSCYDGFCKCNANFYRNNNQCIPVSEITVTSFSVTTTTTTSITFNWTVSSSDFIKNFIITGAGDGTPIDKDLTTTAITGLTPGTTYTNLQITAVVATDRGDVNVNSTTTTATTIPGKAGSLLASNVYNTSKDMIIGFNPPPTGGGVNNYRVIITDAPIAINIDTPTPSITLQPMILTPGRTYTITITTLYEDKAGETSTQTFITLAGGSTPVQNLTINNLTNRSLTVSWSYPADDNGNLTSYVMDITNNEGCIQQYRYFYDVNNMVTGVTSCNQVVNVTHNLQQPVTQDITDLLPYTNYTISVMPYNPAGPGQSNPQQVQTLIEAPSEPTEFNTTELTAYIVKFVWKKPEPKPGPTNYTLIVYEQSALSDVTVSQLYRTQTITGYDREEYVLTGLTSFWFYRATLQAVTTADSSSPVSLSDKFQTSTSAPGKVKDLKNETLENNFTAVTVKWKCPDEKDRHGIIKGYTFSYNSAKGNQEKNITEPSDCTYSESVPVTPGETYSIIVLGYTEEYLGVNSSIVYTAPFGKPIISKDENRVVKTTDPGTTSQTSFSVNICSSCLLDDTNGEIIFTALLVCRKDTCKLENLQTVDEYKSYRTWLQAKKDSFDTPYKITNNSWYMDLKPDPQWQTIVIGDQNGCDTGNDETICDGPLNSNTEYRVIAVSCTRGGCSSTGPQGVFKTKAEESSSVVAIVVPIVVVLLVATGLILGFIWYKRRPKEDKDDRNSLHSIDSTPKSDTPLHRPIKLENFEERLVDLKRDSNLLFSEEFEGIAELSPKHPSTAAILEDNKIKNRYVNILPFDHSRVKLLPIDDDDTTDYMNANYIPGYKSQREYIATQGPLECTVNDFWRMIWEQRVAIIVMLSDLQEKGKPKVDKYWQELFEVAPYGEIDVELKNVSVLNKYTIKIFEMKLGDEIRKVRHFFLPGWEDYRANLQPADVLEFLSVVRQEVKPINMGPMVVHCSAGVGRTGTFIALDIFQQYINDRSLSTEIDVYDLVLRMRNFRQSMVQSEKQYIFIHETVKEIILQKKRKLMENDSVIYENTQVDHTYSNEAFVSDNDVYMNVDNAKPTTVL